MVMMLMDKSSRVDFFLNAPDPYFKNGIIRKNGCAHSKLKLSFVMEWSVATHIKINNMPNSPSELNKMRSIALVSFRKKVKGNNPIKTYRKQTIEKITNGLVSWLFLSLNTD